MEKQTDGVKDRDTKTFIANIRVDIRHIATIARYLSRQGVFVATKSRVAGEAVRLIALGIVGDAQITSHREAVIVLKELGYDSSIEKGTRYYRALTKEIQLEVEKDNITGIVGNLVKKDDKQSIDNLAETVKIIKPVDVSHPVSRKEQTDVDSMRKALGGDAPVAEVEADG